MLGVQQSPGKTLEQSVLDYLTSTSLLIVLDNCEHLLNPVAKLVDSALKAAPGVRVLATSREGLAVSGEHLITVPSLQTPENTMALDELLSTESVRLFTDGPGSLGRTSSWDPTMQLRSGSCAGVLTASPSP